VNIIQFKFNKKQMEGIIWGEVPAQRKRKEEKYNFAVVTMSAIVEKGAGRKFSFNKAAQELLGIQGEDRVSFGFTPDGKNIYLRKASGEAGFQLTKTCTISDKKTYEFISKRLNLDNSIENDFVISSVADTIGEGVCEMSRILETTEVAFANTQLGDISDVEDLSADLSSIPNVEDYDAISETKFDSDTYETAPIEDLFEEEMTMPEPTSGSDEDVW
jgi:hypothetical protein